jgi:hypothetical protein
LDLDPDDPRRLEEGADVALLRQFLTEKEMDGFGHIGQSVACALRALRPSRSGEAIIEIQRLLNRFRDEENAEGN